MKLSLKPIAVCAAVFAPLSSANAQEAVSSATTPATNPLVSSNPYEFATLPEGKTLPERVLRTRVVYAAVKGNGDAYDSDGAKKTSPVKVDAKGGAVIFEYGLSDRLSLQFQQNYTLDYTVSSDPDSSAYGDLKSAAFSAATGGARNATELKQAVALKLASNSDFRTNFCSGSDQNTCFQSILSGTAKNSTGAAFDTGVTGLSVPNGATFNAALDAYSQAMDAAITDGIDGVVKRSGGKGLGDTTLGFLYAVHMDQEFEFSVGAGVRYGSGNRDRSTGEEKVGRGLTETGVRINLDYLPVAPLRLSYQNISEVMLASGSYKLAGQNVTVKRNGVRNRGFFLVKPSPAAITPALSILAPKLGISYDYDSEEVLKVGSAEEKSNPRGYQANWYAGIAVSGFDLGVPLQLEVEYEKAMRGKNVAAAVDVLTTQLKGFYRF